MFTVVGRSKISGRPGSTKAASQPGWRGRGIHDHRNCTEINGAIVAQCRGDSRYISLAHVVDSHTDNAKQAQKLEVGCHQPPSPAPAFQPYMYAGSRFTRHSASITSRSCTAALCWRLRALNKLHPGPCLNLKTCAVPRPSCAQPSPSLEASHFLLEHRSCFWPYPALPANNQE
jgi:hypothetical protein